MSKKEKITQDILDLRVYLVALIASFVALIGYVVNHYEKNDFLRRNFRRAVSEP